MIMTREEQIKEARLRLEKGRELVRELERQLEEVIRTAKDKELTMATGDQVTRVYPGTVAPGHRFIL